MLSTIPPLLSNYRNLKFVEKEKYLPLSLRLDTAREKIINEYIGTPDISFIPNKRKPEIVMGLIQHSFNGIHFLKPLIDFEKYYNTSVIHRHFSLEALANVDEDVQHIIVSDIYQTSSKTVFNHPVFYCLLNPFQYVCYFNQDDL